MTEIIDDIYKSLGKFLVPQTLEQTYKTIVEEGCRLSGAVGGIITLRKKGIFNIVYYSDQIKSPITPRKEGSTYKALKTKKIIIVKKSELLKIYPILKNRDFSFLAYIPLSYGKRTVGVLTLKFITDEKLVEEKMKILQLFGSLASLVIRKMQYYEQTKEALENRDLFISLASHELKTPLTAIQICTNLLNKKNSSSEIFDKVILKNLTDSTNRITNLVNDFLHLDQIRNKELSYDFRNEGLVGIITNLIETHKLINPNYPITLINKIVGDDQVATDSYKLTQAFNNLLNNAIKFSPPNSSIQIFLDEKDSNFLIHFIDHGIGITKKDQKQLFEKFYKGESKKKGMGLGLYLAKKIIEKHNGEIKVKSMPNKGTNIIVSLPKK